MLAENIKRLRKARGLSQKELALRLNVVRQTVSKWENNLSVPDSDVLVRLAELLDVSVSQLLGVPIQKTGENLAEELARLNAELADCARRERLTQQANKKRGLILTLVFASLLITRLVHSEAVTFLLFAGCALAALVIYYRNLALLTAVSTQDADLRTLRLTTIFNVAMIAVIVLISLLHQTGIMSLTEEGVKTLVVVCITVFFLFTGYISPKLPFNRHTGLRLPWTVLDGDTWNVAHRVLNRVSLPAALLYPAAVWALHDFMAVTLTIVLLYIGIPGIWSLLFFWKKFHGK